MDFLKNIKLPQFNNKDILLISGVSSSTILCGFLYKFYRNRQQNNSLIELQQTLHNNNISDNILNSDKIINDFDINDTNTLSWFSSLSNKFGSFVTTSSLSNNKQTEMSQLLPIINVENILNNNNNIYSILIGCTYKGTPYEVSNSIQNVESISNLIQTSDYFKHNIRNPLILTDNSLENGLQNLLQEITNVYNKCRDGDTVFLYYSGYCDYMDEDKEDVFTILTSTTHDIKIDSITINSILDIFQNQNINLIVFMDGFYYSTLSENEHQKSNHLLISSFINDTPIKYSNKTKITSEIITLLINDNIINKEHDIWKKLNVLGNQSLIYDIM
jgi:hypothetical protein